MKLFGREYHQPKGYCSGATHRTRSPAETLSAWSGHMSALGITRLANVTGLDCVGIPVYMAIRPNSRSLAVSQGKGLTAEQARASALMESIENWHAEWMQLPARVASYSELHALEPTIDLAQLPLRSGGELRMDLPMPWVQGYDLLREESVWVPYEFVTANTLLAHMMRLTFFNSSNGLASGNHLLEATLHGLLELVERDAIEAWNRLAVAEQRCRKLALGSVDDPDCRELLDRFSAAGVFVAAWDMTSAVGLPTYGCVIGDAGERQGWRNLGLFRGFGCHLSAAVALNRALCEAAQGRLTMISGSRDDNPMEIFEQHRNPNRLAVERASFFGSAGSLSFTDQWDLSESRFEHDIELVLERLRKAGHERAVVVDLTQPRFEIPVVKVVVPTLGVDLHVARNASGTRYKEQA
jgi:YcaO-like protein with predicted kinase domain